MLSGSRKGWKIVKRIFLGLGIFSIALVTLAVAFVYFFEGRIKKYAINQLNENLVTPVQFDQLNFSLFKRFPKASLEFTQVKCQGLAAKKDEKPLLEAESIFFEFNIWDILSGNYTVKSVTLRNGQAHMLVGDDGKNNFDIWKEKPKKENTTGSKKGKSHTFQLESVRIQNFLFEFDNRKTRFHLNSDISTLHLSGKLSEQAFDLKASGAAYMAEFTVGGTRYIQDQSIQLKTLLKIELDKQQYTLQSTHLEIEKMQLDASGKITANGMVLADLDIQGKNLDVSSFLSVIPAARVYADAYESQGKFYGAGKLSGYLAAGQYPYFRAEFGVNNGKVKHKETGAVLENLVFQGEIFSGETPSSENSTLKIKELSGNIGTSQINGWLNLYNFMNTEIHFGTKSTVDLAEVTAFFPVPQVQKITGKAAINLEMRSSGVQPEQLAAATMQGNIEITDGYVELLQHKTPFANMNGSIQFDESRATLEKFSAQAGSSQFQLNGDITGLVPYILSSRGNLSIQANLSCDQLLVDEWIQSAPPGLAGGSVSSTHLQLPAYITCTLSTQLAKLKFGKFEAADISGKFILRNQRLETPHVSFTTCDGNVSGSGSLKAPAGQNVQVQLTGDLKTLQIQQAFYQMGNFGQTTLLSDNISGKVSAHVEFLGEFTPGLKLIPGTIGASANITIENGQLSNFKPLESLSKFIKIEELKTVKFATLTNQILIRDNQIIIPEMEVKNTAMNLTVSGKHGFDNTIDYHFNLLLRDILAQKFRKKNDKQSEFGDIIEDENKGMRLFIRMTGTVDNPVFTLDRKKVAEKIKQDLILENQTIKEMFEEEFGNSKNDTTGNSIPKKPKPNVIKETDSFEFE